jgi:hypothetical protein
MKTVKNNNVLVPNMIEDILFEFSDLDTISKWFLNLFTCTYINTELLDKCTSSEMLNDFLYYSLHQSIFIRSSEMLNDFLYYSLHQSIFIRPSWAAYLV